MGKSRRFSAFGPRSSRPEFRRSHVSSDKAAATPILGPSFFHGGKEKVHWQPVEMTEEFKTICRREEWDKKQHRKFGEIAGEQMDQLDYSCEY